MYDLSNLHLDTRLAMDSNRKLA